MEAMEMVRKINNNQPVGLHIHNQQQEREPPKTQVLRGSNTTSTFGLTLNKHNQLREKGRNHTTINQSSKFTAEQGGLDATKSKQKGYPVGCLHLLFSDQLTKQINAEGRAVSRWTRCKWLR
eukprot:scaffold23815_cov34-Cyclotella_meneghiniana.AAC.1